MLILVWRKLCIFGLWGPPPLPIFRNYLEEGLYRSFIEGVLSVTLVTITAIAICIFGAIGFSCQSSTDRELFTGSCRCQKIMRTLSSEIYENATSCC